MTRLSGPACGGRPDGATLACRSPPPARRHFLTSVERHLPPSALARQEPWEGRRTLACTHLLPFAIENSGKAASTRSASTVAATIHQGVSGFPKRRRHYM